MKLNIQVFKAVAERHKTQHLTKLEKSYKIRVMKKLDEERT